MPKFIEQKLKKEYPNNPGAVYGTMNKLGYMKGSKETKKGERAEKKHEQKSHIKHLMSEENRSSKHMALSKHK